MASTETIEQVKERIEEVDPAEAQEELKGGDVALIDTREPYENFEAHIDGAELIRPADVIDRIEEVVPDHSQRCSSTAHPATAPPAPPTSSASSATRTPRPCAVGSRRGRPRAFRS